MKVEAPQPEWHVWKMMWTPQQISFFIDESETPIWRYDRPVDDEDTDDNESFPYTEPEYFIVNLAVGGNGPSEPVNRSALESNEGVQLLVDYVRVYALPSDMMAQSSIFTNKADEAGGGRVEVLELPTMGEPLAARFSGASVVEDAGAQGMAALLVCGVLVLLSVIAGRRFGRHRKLAAGPLAETLLSVSEQGRSVPLSG